MKEEKKCACDLSVSAGTIMQASALTNRLPTVDEPRSSYGESQFALRSPAAVSFNWLS